MILARNESNLEQHKKICISQKKEKKQKENRRKTNRKQAISDRKFTKNK